MNTLLESIAANASDDLKRLIEEGEKDILTAIHKATEEAQLQETAPKFNLGFKIAVDLDNSTFDCCLSWTLKQSLTVSHQLEDPNQGKLPGIGEAVKGFTDTVKRGGGSVTIKTAESEITIGKNGIKAKESDDGFEKKAGAFL